MAINISFMETIQSKHSDVKKLYLTYGYTCLEDKVDAGYLVFGLQQGKYFGVEIVQTTEVDTNEIEKLKNSYASNGYATQITRYTGLPLLQRTLFVETFQTEQLNKRTLAKVKRFKEQQYANLGFEYEYIESPYSASPTQDSKSLVHLIKDLLDSEGAKLIVIEAAAGFGKTCTAYEIVNFLIEQSSDKCPLFAELSLNRQAAIFRYVLLDVMDREFTTVKSNVVEYEIQNGRIPLIIDGFDELLDKSINEKIKSPETRREFEKAESMLETVSDLLKGNSKIILTTRRTALLPSGEFREWIDEKGESFDFTRIILSEPDRESWLGKEKAKIVESIRAPIHQLANPVLLSYFRNLSASDLRLLGNSPEKIVEKYFDFMLEREKSRQSLTLTVSEQKSIFVSLAKMMIDLDFTSESKSFIKECILIENETLLEESRERYRGDERPTLRELLDTLANHALLNRAGRDDNEVGFINDYVFGYLAGDFILSAKKSQIERISFSSKILDFIYQANKLRPSEERELILLDLKILDGKLSNTEIAQRDFSLSEIITDSYTGLHLELESLFNVQFSSESKFENVYFINTEFEYCTFSSLGFQNVQFIDCTFRNCTFLPEGGYEERDKVEFLGSKFIPANTSPIGYLEIEFQDNSKNSKDSFSKAEIKILQNFWPKGRQNAHLTRRITTLSKGFSPAELSKANRAIDRLRKRGIIHKDSIYARINREHLAEIKRILDSQ